MKIVFVASESVPYSKTGGLADVVGALPKALASLGYEVEVFLPRYKITKPGAVVPAPGVSPFPSPAVSNLLPSRLPGKQTASGRT